LTHSSLIDAQVPARLADWAYRFNKPVLHLARAMLPMYVILLIGVLLITYVPWLTTGFLR